MQRTQIDLQNSLHDSLKRRALVDGISMSELIRRTLEEKIQSDPAADARGYFDRLQPLQRLANVSPQAYGRVLELVTAKTVALLSPVVAAEVYAGAFEREHKDVEGPFKLCERVDIDHATAVQLADLRAAVVITLVSLQTREILFPKLQRPSLAVGAALFFGLAQLHAPDLAGDGFG